MAKIFKWPLSQIEIDSNRRWSDLNRNQPKWLSNLNITIKYFDKRKPLVANQIRTWQSTIDCMNEWLHVNEE